MTSITLAVPDVDASTGFFTDFGLRRCEHHPGRLATRDGGEQIELVEGPRRALPRLGVGAEGGEQPESQLGSRPARLKPMPP